jgi:hypothetical protein
MSQLTSEERKVLYQWILKKFGTWKQWNENYVQHPPRKVGPTVPPGRGDEWHEFCAMFAKLAGLAGRKTVQGFVNNALPFTIPSSGPTRRRHINHMHAALEAGFIDAEDIARVYPAPPHEAA